MARWYGEIGSIAQDERRSIVNGRCSRQCDAATTSPSRVVT